MTVAVGTRLDQAGDGSTTAFFPGFWAKSDTAFTVTLELDTDGTKTDQVLNTHYTVTFASGTSGVPTVTMITAPPAGYTIRIVPLAVISQTNTIGSTSPIFGSSVEQSEDEIAAILQSLSDRVDQALSVAQDDPGVDSLGDWKDRLDKYLYFNATTGQPEMRDLAVVQAELGMLDADLAAIAALTPSNDDIIQRKAGAWVSRTLVQYALDLLTQADDGTVALPGIAFTADPDTGLYRIGANNLGLTTAGALALALSADGEMTLPLNPAFSAYANSDILNVTGNATAYDVQFNTEVVDRGSNFDTATGIFTAPVTGLYEFSGVVSMLELGAANHLDIKLVTSNRTYLMHHEDPTSPGGGTHLTYCWASCVVDMDLGDTALVRLTVEGLAGDTADIDGGADMRTAFAGRLVG